MSHFNSTKEQREYLLNTWKKAQSGLILDKTEQDIASIIKEHPEFINLINRPEASHSNNFMENPFLHIFLHLAIKEQLFNDQPKETKKLYNKLLSKKLTPHHAEHQIMLCLDIFLKRNKSDMHKSQLDYLECLKKAMK